MPTAPFGFLRLAAAAPKVTVGDPEANVSEMLRTVAEAKSRGAQVIVFPELGLTGYTVGDLFLSLETLVGGAERALGRLLAETASHPMVVAVGTSNYHTSSMRQNGALELRFMVYAFRMATTSREARHAW